MQLQGRRLSATPSGHVLLPFLLLCFLSKLAAEDLLELSCTADTECAQFEQAETSAKCQEGRCVCRTLKEAERVNCKPKDRKLSNIIGGPCPCSQPHTECDKAKQLCLCAKDYIASKDRRRCLPSSVPLNGTCELEEQCQLTDTFATCHAAQARCLCKSDFEPHQGKCLSSLSSSCSNDTDCDDFDASAFCLPLLHKCACQVGYVSDRKMMKCVRSAAYNAACTNNGACQLQLGPGGICQDKRCACRAQHYPSPQFGTTQNATKSIICRPTVVLGSYCRDDSNCAQHPLNETTLQTMECKLGECHCSADHETLDNMKCVRVSAGTCFKLVGNHLVWLVMLLLVGGSQMN